MLEVNVQKLVSDCSALPLLTRYKTEIVIVSNPQGLVGITCRLLDVYPNVENCGIVLRRNSWKCFVDGFNGTQQFPNIP